MCLLCDHATARDYWEMSQMKGAKFGPPPPTGHLPLQTLLRGETKCFVSYTILYLFYGESIFALTLLLPFLKSKSTVLVYMYHHPHQLQRSHHQ